MKRLSEVLVLALALAGAVVSAPALAAPSQPTNVVVESISPAGTGLDEAAVRVSWRASTGAVSYSVSATAAGETTRSGSTASCQNSNCTSSVVDLAGGVSYSFLVTAVGSDGSQTAATAVNFTPTSIPDAPTATSATVSNGQAVLTWVAPTNTGGLALSKFRITDGNTVDLDIDPDAVSYTVTGLTVGSTYQFQITAVNNLGESASDDFTAVTITSAPNAPATPTASVSGSSITVNWTTPANNGSTITGYTVYLVSSSGSDVGQPISPNPATATTATFTNVAAGTYTVQVVTLAGDLQSGRSENSAQVSIASGSLDNTPIFNPTTIPNLDINATQNVTVTAPSGGNVTVSISANPAGACTYSAGVITAVSSGTCTLTATVPANATYAEGSGSKSFNVKLAQSITFSTIENQSFPGNLSLSGVSSSGLSVRYSADGACTVLDRSLTFTSTGTCTVTATQPGNGVYGAAQSVVRTFQITSSGGGGGFGGGAGGGGSSGGGGSPGGSAAGPGLPGGGSTTIPKEVKTRSDYMVITQKGRVTKSLRLTRATTTTSIRLGQTVRTSVSGLPRGTRVSTTIRTPDKKTFALTVRTVGSSRSFSTGIIRPTQKGTYTITLTYGKTKRTLNVRVG